MYHKKLFLKKVHITMNTVNQHNNVYTFGNTRLVISVIGTYVLKVYIW